MMRNLLKVTTTSLLVLALPIAALADLKGTPTLSANMALSLDTGATSASGGDILWSGAAMTPQGKAGAFNLGALGAATFAALPQSALTALPYSASPIPVATLVVGDVFGVKTNGGNYAAVLVTAVTSGGSISLQFVTFGVSGGPAGPTITNIINNFGLIPAGFPNSGIAPGALIAIAGSGLADPAAQVVLSNSSAAGGIPTTLNGASVKITVNGTTTVPGIYYAIAAQLAVVVPSNTPTGSGTVTVTYNGQTSAPFNITVAQSAMGFDSYYGTGSGLGVATNALTGALYNYSNSVPPGTNVVLWGSGLGADAARDVSYVPAAFNINNLAHVYVGGLDAAILYQGASGFPGVNQVNITIPASAPTGCNVSVVGVTAGGVPTNFLTLPIGTGPCSDPAFGTSGSQLTNLSGQTTVKTGFLGLSHSVSPASSGSGTQTNDLAFASFQSVTGSSYGAGGGSVSIGGGCVVTQSASAGGSSGTTTGLNAGTISVMGPNGTATLMSIPQLAGFYEAQLATGFISSSGGSYTFTGSGGTDVQAFSGTLTFPNPLLTWTNQAAGATVTRSTGVPIMWTGGAAGTFVVMNGSSSSGSVYGSFTCIAPVSAGQFNVPGYVTQAMPAGNGSLTVSNYTNYQTFTAKGLDFGLLEGYSSTEINSTYK